MNNTLTTGGITASMINTANVLSQFYDVSIFCYLPYGSLKDRLSEKVHILDSTWRFQAMCSTLAEARKLGFRYAAYKIFARCWSVLFGNRLPIFIALCHQPNLGDFDLACCYTHEGGRTIEYTGLIRVLLYRINAPKKLSWVHCDYNHVPYTTYNNKYFNAVDAIVGVSESIGRAFQKNNPKVKPPIDTCYNMLDYSKIYQKAEEPLEMEFPKEGVICFSACRLSNIKAIVRMVTCCKEVFIRNNVYWYIAGDGPEEANIQKAIREQGLQGRVILLGEQLNPFPYIKRSDLYLSVSYEEAAPLVYFEAKALHTPVFSTETLSTRELLNPEIDFICGNDEKSIRDAFEKVTADVGELHRRKEKLSDYLGTNQKSIDFFKRWMND